MPSKRSLDLLKAAYYSVYGPALTQDQIATRVGLTQGQVSRLLEEARDQKILREVFRFPADLSLEDRLEIVNSFYPRHGQLEEALSEALPEAQPQTVRRRLAVQAVVRGSRPRHR